MPFSSLHDAYRVFHNSEIPRNRWKIILIVTSINFLMEKKNLSSLYFFSFAKKSSKKSFEIAKIIFHMFRLVSLIFTEQNSSDMTRDRCPICHTEKFSIFFVCCLTQSREYERFWISQWHFWWDPSDFSVKRSLECVENHFGSIFGGIECSQHQWMTPKRKHLSRHPLKLMENRFRKLLGYESWGWTSGRKKKFRPNSL